MNLLNKDFKFVDLFSGIGGFHYAMKKLSPDSKCVFASEINKNANKLYQLNHGIISDNDITNVDLDCIDFFDILCAGFPCQTFSKAGQQNGFSDARGTLFFNIVELLENQIKRGNKPKVLVLENVKNLITHDKGRTWSIIYKSLRGIGYNVIKKPLVLNPVQFNIPQLRDRAIILAIDENIFSDDITFDIHFEEKKNNLSIFNILERNTINIKKNYGLSDYEIHVLNAWDHFIKNLNTKKLGFPIWSDEFGLTYDISNLPNWKQSFINKNRELYLNNKKMIDEWRLKFDVNNFVKTHRKFEWQAGNDYNSVYEGIILFRPSGIRVKKPNYSPTLVAMTHIPIIGKHKRYITPKEALRLQSFPDNFNYESVGKDIYRLIGNAVNVNVIYEASKQFVEYIENQIKGETK